MYKVKRTERGWGGHYCNSLKCKFRRNTLLEYKNIKIVVSSVGLQMAEGRFEYEEIGCGRHFETMAFHSKINDSRYNDVDVSRQIDFNSKWSIAEIDADDIANDMHEAVVDEITKELLGGNRYE